MTNTFDEIKNRIDITDAAERFGVRVGKNGRALCFAHDDHNPSLSFKNGYFHCFSCGASGDVINMIQHLHNITAIEAAKILDNMYGLSLFKDKPTAQDKRKRAAQAEKHRSERERIEAFEAWETWASAVVGDYVRTLSAWKAGYAPQCPDEPRHPRFDEALDNYDLWDNLFDAVFICGDFETKTQFYKSYRKRVSEIAKRIYGGSANLSA